MTQLNSAKTTKFINQIWDQSIIPTLEKYIAIPCKSPAYDKVWQEHGYMEQAVKLASEWCEQQAIPGLKLTVHRLPGRTPLLMLEVPGTSSETVVLYGHMDKQPEMVGWSEDLGPWKPVIKNDCLYGRGGADDGYAVFAVVSALKTLHEQNIPHARCVVLIECCEESGSYDLPYYVEHLQNQIGTPALVVCLDSGCGNYNQLWLTTSLRGNITGNLKVEILTEGVHSGAASGIVPSSFRIIRQLLSRLEDEDTGVSKVKKLEVDIPSERIQQAIEVGETLGDHVWQDFPFVKGARPASLDNPALVLNHTWHPTLSITGVGGIPALENAGNVLRPQTTLTLSFRIPPTCNYRQAETELKKILENDPPYGAKVSFTLEKSSPGWNAPVMADWLIDCVKQASLNYFGKEALYWGEGGTIPFMGMLGEKFPQAQFVITGVLGPHSNAHGPNEFLHIPTAKKLSCCVAHILAEHGSRT